MKDPMTLTAKLCARPLPLAAVGLVALAAFAPMQNAFAQAFCASDGQPQPVQLLERFINADCESCWKDHATAKVGKGQAVLDWVVPGRRADDAPLSAVASSDGLSRLEALKKKVPAESMTSVVPVRPLKKATLRVAHGIALSGYAGVSIELKPAMPAFRGQQLTAWLALVETIAEGTEGTPVERNLVRGVLQTSWDGRKSIAKTDPDRFFDARTMSVASGVNGERLKVIGWVEDRNGNILAAAQSKCELAAK